MMPAEFIQEALVGPIFQAAVPQLIGQFGLQRLRLVGVRTSKSYCFFLTNLPPRVGPRQVADLYRVRWEVELSIKLDKSVHCLDAIDAERPCSLKTLLHASLIASILAALLAHTHIFQNPSNTSRRTVAPLHTRLLALQLAVSCQSIAQAFDLPGSRGHTTLEQDRGVAHTCRERSQLATSAVRMRSVARLETPAGCSRAKP